MGYQHYRQLLKLLCYNTCSLQTILSKGADIRSLHWHYEGRTMQINSGKKQCVDGSDWKHVNKYLCLSVCVYWCTSVYLYVCINICMWSYILVFQSSVAESVKDQSHLSSHDTHLFPLCFLGLPWQVATNLKQQKFTQNSRPEVQTPGVGQG